MSQNLNWLETVATNVSGLMTCEQELIDIACDGSLKDMFDADKLPQPWLLVRQSSKGFTSFCETGFSAVAVMRTKYQSWLITEKELQIPFHQ
jgi:hypothetical protein